MDKQIIFRLKDQFFALPISKVERIIHLEVTSTVPDLEDHIMGVTTYNDQILPVVNLAKRFFHGDLEKEENSPVLVTLWKEERVGLVVDQVTEIKTVDKQELTFKQDTTDAETFPIDDTKRETLQSVYAFLQTEQGIVSFLDTDELFNEKASQDIRHLVKIASLSNHGGD